MSPTYVLGTSSRKRLEGVHPDLVALVHTAIALTTVDFAVAEGLRTPEEQRALYDSGASRKLDSRHLTGHAVDLVPYVGGRLRWDWPLCYHVAAAMQEAAAAAGVAVRWGGVWDRQLVELDSPEHPRHSPHALREAVADYVARRRRQNRDAFIDGPHFELI